jgi:YVTN family beta-propeller protein
LQGPFPVTGSSAPNLHGIALTKNSDTLYVTCQEISKILKIPVNDVSGYQDINLFPFGGAPATPLKPHQVEFTPDYSKYIVTCQNSNEVRVMDVHTDAFITAIPVGKYPLEIAISQSRNLAFITNEEDDFFAGMRGSVSVIDLSNNTELMKIKVGWQPHGIVVDEKRKVVYVANRNVSGGVAPHHSSACIGTNGYLSEIDLQTLVRNPSFKPELSVDPYAITIRP